jgi:hypothetical protein
MAVATAHDFMHTPNAALQANAAAGAKLNLFKNKI